MTPWVRRLIAANVVVFFLEMVAPQLTASLPFVPVYVLEQPWTIVTYMFVHAGFMHILFNMIGLYFFGPRVEERLGSGNFVVLYFLSGIAGAVASFIFAPMSPIVGASAAVIGVLMAFAWFWPREQIYIFGILPIEARLAVILFAVFSIWSGFNGSRSGIADFAHLGGFAGAGLYLLWFNWRHGSRRFRTKTVTKVGRDALANWKKVDPRSIHEVNRDEVNRILDKINASGLGSLTPQERLFLSNFVPPDDRVPPPT